MNEPRIPFHDDEGVGTLLENLIELGPPPVDDRPALLRWDRAYRANLVRAAGEGEATGLSGPDGEAAGHALAWRLMGSHLEAVDRDLEQQVLELERDLGLEPDERLLLGERVEALAEILSPAASTPPAA